MPVQLTISNVLAVGRLIAFEDNCRLISMFFEVPINAIGADIQHTIFKPFYTKITFVKRDIFDF